MLWIFSIVGFSDFGIFIKIPLNFCAAQTKDRTIFNTSKNSVEKTDHAVFCYSLFDKPDVYLVNYT